MLNWVQQFNIFCLLDNQQYALPPNRYEFLVGAGCEASIDGSHHSFEATDDFLKHQGWTFGHLSYEAGYAFHGMEVTKKNVIAFPPFFFFRPQVVLFLRDGLLCIDGEDEEAIYREVLAASAEVAVASQGHPMEPRLTREEYLGKITALQEHIARGDCYEINFCQEFFAEGVAWDPAAAFTMLSDL
jgi:para-aminobenzoate synthetase component 1